MSLEDKLRQYGVPDDEIEEILNQGDDDEDDRLAKPRNLGDWKRRSRHYEQQLTDVQRKLATYEMRDQFEEARAELPDEIRSLVSFEDVRNEAKVTPALLKVKAQEKQEQVRATREEFARSIGLESVEQLEEFTSRFKAQAGEQQQQQAQARQDMAAASSVAFNLPAPAMGSATRQDVEQMVAQDVSPEEILKTISRNPQAFAMPLGRDDR